MARIMVACAIAGAVVLGAAGCSQNGQKINSPLAKVDSTKSPKKPEYFEVRREGKVYVLGNPDSLKAFNEGRTPRVKPVADLGGKTVYVENRNYTDHNRLVADYKKQHNL
jgi:hypothetical protein